jgi:anaerobic selenocysteine-containing dehydrogenase
MADAPRVLAQGDQQQIRATVYRLPCAGFAEKHGSFTNSARWLLWKNTAVPLSADCRLDRGIVARIFLKARELHKKEGGKFPDPILNAQEPVHAGRMARLWRGIAKKRVDAGDAQAELTVASRMEARRDIS